MEYLSIFDNEGRITDKVVIRGDKSVVLEENEHIGVGVIFIDNDNGEFLIQKTSIEKGGEYSSTGGHINSGETPIESIKREVYEEIGVDISKDEVVELGYLLYDMPIRFMFYLKKNIDVNELVLQDEEVESIQYMKIDEIKKLINKGMMLESHARIFDKVLEYKSRG